MGTKSFYGTGQGSFYGGGTYGNGQLPISFIEKTVGPASIISFNDGLKNKPLKECIVDIDPVQDLHRYSNPWPAGGGKNKWHLYANGYYSNSGAFSSEPFNGCSEKMPTTPGQAWTFSAIKRGTEQVRLRGYFFDANDAIVGSQVAGNNTVSGTAPEGAVTVAWWYSVVGRTETITQAYSDSIGIQVELGSTATSYAPYSNVCPITGFTAARVTRCGKNLLSTKLYTGLSYNPAVGTVANFAESADQFTTTDHETFTITFAPTWQVRAMYCSVKPAQTYRFKRYVASTTLATTRGFLDRNFAVISTYNITDATQNTEDTIIAPSNAAYFFFLITNRSTANDTVTVKYPQLELGSTATSYEPYSGQTYDIAFPTEAGTVYGGTLNVTTGVLTVDRASVDLGTIAEIRYTYTGSPYYRFKININGLKPIPVTQQPTALCSMYKGMTGQAFDASPSTTGTFRLDNSAAQIYVRDLRYTDVETFRSAMNGVQFIYELATPLTYQLTPTEVSTLLGTNNIWADTGDTTVTYLAKK